MKYVYAILIVAALIGIYVWLRKENAKTPIPKGCEHLVPECESCGIKDCVSRPAMMKKKNEGEKIE